MLGRTGRSLKGGDSSVSSAADEEDFDSGDFCHPAHTRPAGVADSCNADGLVCYHFRQNPNDGSISFDNVAMAMIPVLQAITFDTWSEPMYDVMDAYSPYVFVYFIAAAIIGGMFVVNLFLAVIFDEFMRAKEMNEVVTEVAEMAAEAAEKASARGEPDADDAKTALIDPSAARSNGADAVDDGGLFGCCDCAPSVGEGWRYGLREVMLSSTLSQISTILVVANLVVMCMPYAGQPESWRLLCETVSSVITWAFIIEMLLKMISMGCAAYWGDGWNQLDGCIVLMSIGEMLVTILLADTGINVSSLRMLRLIRLLRLLKAFPSLYKIVMAFVRAIPQISNLFILMFLLMTIFSLLGMQVRHLPRSHTISPHLVPTMTFADLR